MRFFLFSLFHIPTPKNRISQLDFESKHRESGIYLGLDHQMNHYKGPNRDMPKGVADNGCYNEHILEKSRK
jgi:hypothetical protein